MEIEREAGIALYHPLPGEEIVITGMAGRFPESDDLYQYRNNIYNKLDMITGDNRRWLPTNPEIPHRTGKINHIEHLDAGQFGFHHHEANQMDSMIRMSLEKAYEAILDAGYSASEMVGANCGVFIGSCFSETEQAIFSTKVSPNFVVTGSNRSMTSQRISHYFKLRGPSHSVDTACSSSLYAFEHAYRAIRQGRCESALVGGVSLCLNSSTSLQFARLGVLSMDGRCKPFDEDADGYARSDSISVVFLQKAKDARRIYAQVLHAKTNSDGYKEQGITFPSSEMQKVLLENTYGECQFDPADIDFLEAHATGTKVGDPEELAAVDTVFCTNRKRPLAVGSIKSYLGHAEGGSGMCSLVKVILGMEDDCILPNINFKKPRQAIKALVEGRMVVPVDKMPWPKDGSGVVGINSFGFGGSNVHVILKRFEKRKVNDGLPEDDLPRLMCISGRTEESLQSIMGDIGRRKLDIEYCRLIQQVFKDTQFEHPYRGYIIDSKLGELERSFIRCDSKSRVGLFLPGPTEEVVDIGRQLLQFPVFSGAVERIGSLLPSQKVDLNSLMAGKTARDVVLASLLTHLAFVEVLKELNVPISYSRGISIGELTSAYANGSLSLKQVVVVGHEVSQMVDEGVEFESIFKTKVAALLTRLRKLLPESEKVVERLIAPNPLEKRMRLEKLPVIILGSENVKPNGFPYLNVSGVDAIRSFLIALGRLYTMGHSLKVEMLYPPVKWPVSKGTPMISPLIKWNYDQEWFMTVHNAKSLPLGSRVIPLINKEIDWSFLPGHVIDGLTLMPATGYIYMVWETFCHILELPLLSSRVRFENVKFHKAVNISKVSDMEFKITIGRNTHKFEICEVDQPIVTGSIYAIADDAGEIGFAAPAPQSDDEIRHSSKDIYKELRLRGYNYSGEFRAQESAEISGAVSWVKWDRNWIAFIDNMLQAKVLGEDTRSLYVPTFINQLVIDAPKHLDFVKSLGNASLLPVYNHQDANVMSCGGIELRQLYATAIPRRKARGEPVLETYKFVPFETELPMRSAVRVMVQIFLENTLMLKVKVVELAQTSAIAPIFQEALNDQPLVKGEIAILGDETLSAPNAKVSNRDISTENQCAIIVLERASENPALLNEAVGALRDNGMIISREACGFSANFDGLNVLSVVRTEVETLVLLKKATGGCTPERLISIKLDGNKFDWLPKIQGAIKNDDKAVLVMQSEPLSGALGFVNCLRREPEGMQLKCVLVMDDGVRFNLGDPFFVEQLKKGLAMNVVKNGVWGTYRHLPLESEREVERQHVFCNLEVVGNLSTLGWVEGPLLVEKGCEPERMIVQVHSCPINFKDVMVASGRVPIDAFTRLRLHQTTEQGFEYSGVDPKGRRIMGITPRGSLASLVISDSVMFWKIPDGWSMDEAATVPVTYSTVLFSFTVIAKISRGQSVLIHAGAGGVGQAAINIALFYQCQIFTTVGTEEKKRFILEKFPQIPASHIGHSRDSSFVQMVMKQTKGKGVDIVLNSLAEEKLKASLECLTPRGYFLEIGKYDLVNNNKLALSSLEQGRTYVGCMLDLFFRDDPSQKNVLQQILQRYLDNGAVKPLHYTTFKMAEVEQAYRYMALGKHTGKVVITLRKQHIPQLFKGQARFSCDPSMSYVVIGGLGGFGLELVDWLILRGARNLILVSRTGVRSGYAASRIRTWKTYEAVIRVRTDDVTTEEGCVELLRYATRLAPVAAIFNLAVVLRDGLFKDQTEENFTHSLSPKAGATLHLDAVSRKFCPGLRHFVVFSSVSCGRGNMGQTNYGMANSIMERICEKRKAEGLPGLAIQWGAIGEVGLVAEMQEQHKEIEIGGTLQQRLSSCMACLDWFLTQNEAVVASMVVAEKRSVAQGAESVMLVIKSIMGITDLKKISEHSTLSEMGMDSMTAVEIKQTLERDCEVFLNAKEIRTLTFAKLKEILSNKMSDAEGPGVVQRNNVFNLYLGTEESTSIPIKDLPTLVQEQDEAPMITLLPGIDGVAEVLAPLTTMLRAHAKCIHYPNDTLDHGVEAVANSLEKLVPHGPEHFNIVAYSYGCVVALELVSALERQGRIGNVILIDGSPERLKHLIQLQISSDVDPEPSIETAILLNLLNLFMPSEPVEKHKDALIKLRSLAERVQYVQDLVPKDLPYSTNYQTLVCTALCSKTKAVYHYVPKFPKLKSEVTLFKPTDIVFGEDSEDYRLQEICEKPVRVFTVEGNHATMIKNIELANGINKIVNNQN